MIWVCHLKWMMWKTQLSYFNVELKQASGVIGHCDEYYRREHFINWGPFIVRIAKYGSQFGFPASRHTAEGWTPPDGVKNVTVCLDTPKTHGLLGTILWLHGSPHCFCLKVNSHKQLLLVHILCHRFGMHKAKDIPVLDTYLDTRMKLLLGIYN